jgi:hypothetical protein
MLYKGYTTVWRRGVEIRHLCRGTSPIRSCAPQDPAVGLCLGPYGGPRRTKVSYERGNPVSSHSGSGSNRGSFSPGSVLNLNLNRILQGYLTQNPSGRLGSSSSQYRRTPELVLQKGHASFRITSSLSVQRIAAEPAKRNPRYTLGRRKMGSFSPGYPW